MIFMSDQDERIPFLGKLDSFHVDLGHQRTGGVNHAQPAFCAVLANLRRDSVRAVNNALAVGHFVLAVDKDRALAPKFLDHEAVVDNLLAHINRRPKRLQSNADHVNRPHHARAKAPGFSNSKVFPSVFARIPATI